MSDEVGLLTEAVLEAVATAKDMLRDAKEENPEPIPFMMRKVARADAAKDWMDMPPEKKKEWLAAHAGPDDPQGAQAAMRLLRPRQAAPKPTAQQPITRGGY